MKFFSPNRSVYAKPLVEQSRAERAERRKSKIRFWRDALQVFLALAFLMYGASKLFGLQFSGGPSLWNKPIRDMSGMSLLWAFMAWSRSLQIVVGLGQISAALLLLRRQTALLGAVLYLPLISVVVLFDLCYHVVSDATGMAVVLFAGNALLLWAYRARLHNALRCLVGDAATVSPETSRDSLPTLARTVGVFAAGLGILLVVMALLSVCFPHSG